MSSEAAKDAWCSKVLRSMMTLILLLWMIIFANPIAQREIEHEHVEIGITDAVNVTLTPKHILTEIGKHLQNGRLPRLEALVESGCVKFFCEAQI
jgi:hypothetical protein